MGLVLEYLHLETLLQAEHFRLEENKGLEAGVLCVVQPGSEVCTVEVSALEQDSNLFLPV